MISLILCWAISFTNGQVALSDEDLAKFQCRQNSWQLPEECGSTCTNSDKTTFDCSVSVTIDDSDNDYIILTSKGIPDHNLCAAPPNSEVIEIDYNYRIPRTPIKKTGDLSTFSATNMGEIGFALNGVPIYNPYDAACCDAGLYELEFLDLCYAHPNGPNGRYHYHTWSECLAPCTGTSELIGVALDGYPIMGPGINPDTGNVWSQSDMDECGGQEIDGKYAYYTTVDFPYILQCFRGDTSRTTTGGVTFNAVGNCGLYGVSCNPTTGAGPPNRGRRSLFTDPTTEWFQNLQHLDMNGQSSLYAQEILHTTRAGIRERRSVENLISAIDVYTNSVGRISKETFLKHLAYTCSECNGHRDLVTDCSALQANTCNNTQTAFVFEVTGSDTGTDNDYDADYIYSSGVQNRFGYLILFQSAFFKFIF